MKKSFHTLQSLLLISVFLSCEYFSTTTYMPQQIKKASEWSTEDQGPSFESCQELSAEEQFLCFKDTLSQAVYDALNAEELIASEALNEEIILIITIDNEGNLALDSIENKASVTSALPNLTEILTNAILSLPKAIPSTKTNVGISVATSIKLPIRVVASPQ